jgi:hypothetical protein
LDNNLKKNKKIFVLQHKNFKIHNKKELNQILDHHSVHHLILNFVLIHLIHHLINHFIRHLIHLVHHVIVFYNDK